MSKWIRIDPEDVDAVLKDEQINGISVRVQISPYDIPDRVRGIYEEASGKFRISFKYSVHERTVSKKLDGHTTVVTGKHSGRLYEVEIDVNTLNVNAVQLEVEVSEAITDLSNRAERVTPNLNAARQIIEGKRERLFEEIEAV